jgi:hypothetical protein
MEPLLECPRSDVPVSDAGGRRKVIKSFMIQGLLQRKIRRH